MAEPTYLYFAIHRGEKWVTKRVEDATEQDFIGVNLEREFMSAATPHESMDAALIQVETNLRVGDDPFEAIHDSVQTGPGIELIRGLIRKAGHRISRL
ncbi:MAG TPA: hypothetical protein VI299_01070 [Polyangiales bacterium]